MKRLLFGTIFLTVASAFPVVTMAGVDTNAGITGGVFVVADADADTPQGGPTGRDEKSQDESLEKKKTTESKDKSDWEINVWPLKPPDNMKSFPERKEEQHIPPDRF